jgi:RNA polymerase sigma factor (TIGR02999 family)
MAAVTQLLDAAAAGDPRAAAELLPVVYDELRRLAAARLAAEPAGHTLVPTALVHEAYLRLVGGDPHRQWDGRGHFFAAAAEAMRRILIDHARGKKTAKRGGDHRRADLDPDRFPTPSDDAGLDLLALDEALSRLEAKDRRKAELVKLRYFAGLTVEQAAGVLGVSVSTADNDWVYARCWLRLALGGTDDTTS